MKPEGCEADLLRALSRMPFLDRLEMVAVCGWSRGAVYEAVEKLESGGFCASVPHATGLLPSSRRFHLTATGLRRLAGEDGMALNELVRSRPVSAQWRRSLMERLDAVASVYGVASTVSSLAFPIRFRWYRSIPLDAAMTLPDGRTVGIVRQGLTADRSGFSRRLWGLRDWPMPGTVLVLMADEVRLRHARRLLSTTDVPVLFAVERLAVLTGAGDRIWSPPKVGAEIDLRYALDRVGPGGQLPIEPEPQRADPPADFAVEGPGWDIPDHMLPVLLKPIEKRALDLISDWPWIALKELAGLMGVSTQRVSHGVIPLEGFGLAARPRDAGGWPSPTGGWRSWPAGTAHPWPWRGSGGASPWRTPKARSSGATSPAGEPASCSGTQSTPPPSTASSPRSPRRPPCWGGRSSSSTRPGGRPAHFRHDDRMRAVNPDAFGVLRKDDTRWPFFLEWERRAVRPSTMSDRLAPYLRYFSSHRPTDDHGTRPAVLVVFDDEIARTHFLRVAREETHESRVNVPLLVSHREAVDALGPMGHAWRTPADLETPQALPPQ